MPEQSAEPIPQDLTAHFDQAVLDYPMWSPEQEYRVYRIGQKEYSLMDLCRRVEQFAGTMREEVFQTLRAQMHYPPDSELRDELDADSTYPTAARCMRKMIERRKAEHQQSEARRSRE
jgi:hypothetical protein